jgi:hypothetical protein
MDADGLCEGCFRTLDEIACWGNAGTKRAARDRVRTCWRNWCSGGGAMKHITFYFDFISPYAYLAFEQLPEALEGPELRVDYRPVLFAALPQAARPARPGGDRAQARLDLPPGAVAGACARHSHADAGGASLQPAGPAAAGGGVRRGRLVNRHVRDGLPPCGAAAPTRRTPAPCRSCAACCSRSATRPAPKSEGRTEGHQRSARSRLVRCADLRGRRPPVLGLRRLPMLRAYLPATPWFDGRLGSGAEPARRPPRGHAKGLSP